MKSRLCDNDPHVFLAVCNNNNGAVPLLPPGSWKQLQAREGNACMPDFKYLNEGDLSEDSHGNSTQLHQHGAGRIFAQCSHDLSFRDDLAETGLAPHPRDASTSKLLHTPPLSSAMR